MSSVTTLMTSHTPLQACLTQVEDNVVFNGPRAGINFNDGFGGGTNVTSNLIYNQCRESGDHGYGARFRTAIYT
jgi:hypothetical protein